MWPPLVKARTNSFVWATLETRSGFIIELMVDAVSRRIHVLGIMLGTCISDKTSPNWACWTWPASGHKVMICPGLWHPQQVTFGLMRPFVPGTNVLFALFWSTWEKVATDDGTVLASATTVEEAVRPELFCVRSELFWLNDELDWVCTNCGGLYFANISKAFLVVDGYLFSPRVILTWRSL